MTTSRAVVVDLTPDQVAYYKRAALDWTDPLEVELGHTPAHTAACLRRSVVILKNCEKLHKVVT